MPSNTDIREQVALKPCPFCGGKPEKRLGVGEWWVSCPTCDASSGMRSDYDAAMTAWNTRSARPEVGELAERVQRADAEIGGVHIAAIRNGVGDVALAKRVVNLKAAAQNLAAALLRAQPEQSPVPAPQGDELREALQGLVDASPALIVKAVRTPSGGDGLGAWTAAMRRARTALTSTAGAR